MLELFVLPLQILAALTLVEIWKEYRQRKRWKQVEEDWEFENGLDGKDF